jgi:GT2 family glycosyltransferase
MEFYEMRDANFDDLIEAELLSGSFMLARTNLLKKIDGFDEKFFLYFEDYDLCRRIQARGLKTIYYPGSKAIHFWERSAHKSWKFAFMFLASAFKYFNRWGWKWI